MTDPLDVLRLPLVPLAPDAAFAARLRGRIQRDLTEGDAMTTSQRQLTETEGDVAYFSLQVDDSARARAFYGAVLGWQFGTGERTRTQRTGRRAVTADGDLGRSGLGRCAEAGGDAGAPGR